MSKWLKTEISTTLSDKKFYGTAAIAGVVLFFGQIFLAQEVQPSFMRLWLVTILGGLIVGYGVVKYYARKS